MEFKEFKQGLQKQFNKLTKNDNKLFLTDVDKNEMWNHYLRSFPGKSKQWLRQTGRRSLEQIAMLAVDVLFTRTFFLVGGIHRIEIMAVTAFSRVGFFHRLPDIFSQF